LFGIFFPVLVYYAKKNLATLLETITCTRNHFHTFSPVHLSSNITCLKIILASGRALALQSKQTLASFNPVKTNMDVLQALTAPCTPEPDRILRSYLKIAS
jgi:hypothetical protein